MVTLNGTAVVTNLNLQDFVAFVDGVIIFFGLEFDCSDIEDTRHLHCSHPAPDNGFRACV